MVDENFINEEDNTIVEEDSMENSDLYYDLKSYFRLYRRKLSAYLRAKFNKDLRVVLYVTSKNPPLNFIQNFRKQYPDKNIKIIIPKTEPTPDSHRILDFDYFAQNRVLNATMYKRKQDSENIEIYELCIDKFQRLIFDETDFTLYYFAPLMKALRICINFLKPNILHIEELPLFFGNEFDSKPLTIKSILTISDINDENYNIDAFWAAINIFNKKFMKKLCKDKFIQKYIFALFNARASKKIDICLDYFYENFEKYRKSIEFDSKERENLIIQKLNERTEKLFPQLKGKNGICNFYESSINKANKIVLNSKTYYKELEKAEIKKFKDKYTYIVSGSEFGKEEIYKNFDLSNFRDFKIVNKDLILKEFSENRIKTDFIDKTLFENNLRQVKGFLLQTNAPLIFSSISNSFNQGVDIVLLSIIKIIELQKNVHFIINIPNGLSDNKIKQWSDFIEDNLQFAGKIVFIDGYINPAKFLAASDMIMLPYRKNINSTLCCEAMKNGCIPIYSNIGYLNDVVTDIFNDIINGRGFVADFSVQDEQTKNFTETLIKALHFYNENSSGWKSVIKNAMKYDISWNFNTLAKYNEIYEDL